MLSVIIPTYNEEKTIQAVIAAVLDLPEEVEIIVVDDGSDDGTWNQLSMLVPRIKTLRHAENRGKGAAVRTALPHTTGELVVIQDADLEYQPSDLPKLAYPIRSGEADVVYGSRFLGTKPSTGYLHHFANWLISQLCSFLARQRLTDVETCYKMVRGDLARKLAPKLQEERFGIEIEMTCILSQMGARFLEVPIKYHPRTWREGKKIGWRDGVAALGCIARYGLFGKST